MQVYIKLDRLVLRLDRPRHAIRGCGDRTANLILACAGQQGQSKRPYQQSGSGVGVVVGVAVGVTVGVAVGVGVGVRVGMGVALRP